MDSPHQSVIAKYLVLYLQLLLGCLITTGCDWGWDSDHLWLYGLNIRKSLDKSWYSSRISSTLSLMYPSLQIKVKDKLLLHLLPLLKCWWISLEVVLCCPFPLLPQLLRNSWSLVLLISVQGQVVCASGLVTAVPTHGRVRTSCSLNSLTTQIILWFCGHKVCASQGHCYKIIGEKEEVPGNIS